MVTFLGIHANFACDASLYLESKLLLKGTNSVYMVVRTNKLSQWRTI